MISVLHIVTAMSWRGGEQQLSYMLEELALQNIKLFVLAPKNSEVIKYCEQHNISCFSIKKSHNFSLKWAKNIHKICNANKINIVHTHDSKAHTLSVLSAIFFNNNINIIVHRKVVFKIKNSFLTKFKYNYKKIKAIICISKAVQKEVLKIMKSDNTTLIYDAINHEKNVLVLDLREHYKIPQNHKIIGYVAALSYEKDHETFLKTAKLLVKENENLSFFIIGDGKLKEEIKTKISELNLQKNVFLTGFLENAKYIISQFNVLLFTSKLEGLGTTILDAFYVKTPVVTVKNGGVEELVIPNKTGCICNVADVVCLAKNVENVLNNKENNTKLVENAYRLVIKNHDTKIMAIKLVEVYSQIKNI